MPHVVNRNAFLAAKGCGHPLLSAYGLLVATELALKEDASAWAGHDLPGMLSRRGDPGLTALGESLRLALVAVPCTDRQGNNSPVPGSSYPYLRYARHANDFTGGATDAHLQVLIQTADDIIAQLRAKGVAV
jgi:hypothetical protein